jgi:hypothetical protein
MAKSKADKDEGLPPAPDPETKPAPDPETEPEPAGSAYEQAVAFEPETWDQLPEDAEVRKVYVALNGHINFFIKRRA